MICRLQLPAQELTTDSTEIRELEGFLGRLRHERAELRNCTPVMM